MANLLDLGVEPHVGARKKRWTSFRRRPPQIENWDFWDA